MDIQDQEERDIVAHAELIVDGDPTNPHSLLLVKYLEQPAVLKKECNLINIHSIRENTPDIEEI